MGDNETGPSWLLRINNMWREAQTAAESDEAIWMNHLSDIADISHVSRPRRRSWRTGCPYRASLDRDRDAARGRGSIRALRGGEHYEPMIRVLEFQEKLSSGEDKRNILMELGNALPGWEWTTRKLAAKYFDQIIKVDKDDREAWGEYIECLEEIGDHQLLLDAISKRCSRAQGLERRQLMRRRIELLMEAGELKPPEPTNKPLKYRYLAIMSCLWTRSRHGAELPLKHLFRRDRRRSLNCYLAKQANLGEAA